MRLLAQGRDGKVFDMGDGTVLRRHDDGRSQATEAATMEHARRAGYPVPAVVSVDGGDLVMAKVDGPTMLADIARRPWRLRRHAATLGDLHRRLHTIPAPDHLDGPWPESDETALLHLDFHPENVMLTPTGPVVIDWTNARAGPPAADVGTTSAVLRTAEIPGGRLQRRLVGLGRSALDRRYLSAYGPLTDRDRWFVAAARRRLDDPNLRPSERARLEALADSAE